MKVKVENLEQEKYVLECAEKDSKRIGSNLTGISTPYYIIHYDNAVNLWCYENAIKNDEFLTFEQFKAQREEQIKTIVIKNNRDDLSVVEDALRIQELEKEVEELKNKLREIEEFFIRNISEKNEGNDYDKIVSSTMKIGLENFFQTPSQTEANEIIKNASPEALEELKKLLQ
tara:strand:+ start:740 stop:1258 length:519 start_codon:yes stop_codon:yes gene_type:complete